MPAVYPSTPYRSGALGSLGNAAYMLICQYQFPVDTYSENDQLTSADSDRCFQWDFKHARRCFTEHTGTGEMGLEQWVRRSSPKKVIAFIRDILKADEAVNWTGYRVMGTVHRGNGYVVWTLELFAKAPDSETEVVDDDGGESFGSFYFQDRIGFGQ